MRTTPTWHSCSFLVSLVLANSLRSFARAQAVVDYIKQFGEESEQGVSIQDMVVALGKTHSEASLKAAVEALSNEGMIYSTIDENTFKYAL